MRTKLLLSIAVALLAASFSNLHAQTEGKKREVGIQFSGINFDGFTSFAGLYRKQKSGNVYRRIRASFGNITFISSGDDNDFNFSAGVAIGREKRKMLDRKLEFYQGPEFSFSLGLQTGTDQDGQVSVGAGFGYVIGLQHSFSDLWAIHLETIPSIGVNFLAGGDIDDAVVALGAGFSGNVLLGVVRKF